MASYATTTDNAIRKETVVTGLISRINALAVRIEGQASSLKNTFDDLVGVQPQEIKPPLPEPGMAIINIYTALDAVEHALMKLEVQVSRLR